MRETARSTAPAADNPGHQTRIDLRGPSPGLTPPRRLASPSEMSSPEQMTSIEVCAGAGGQALGLESAGFEHLACVEIDAQACETLRLNRPEWGVLERDLIEVVESEELVEYEGCDLLAGGVPCPPFSMAGKQLGADDERDLFPAILGLAEQLRPGAVLIENVRGLLSKKFDPYRREVLERLDDMGYRRAEWELLQASDYGVPQLRPRALLVAIRDDIDAEFVWPTPDSDGAPTVGEALGDLMAAGGWEHAEAWEERANRVAPTIVGGSKKHGGPDLGPTRAKREWAGLGCDGKGVANEAPGPDAPPDFTPRLTNRMVARLQGFPDEWEFAGKKTAQYRQIGNAFPPPVAEAVGRQIASALNSARSYLAAA